MCVGGRGVHFFPPLSPPLYIFHTVHANWPGRLLSFSLYCGKSYRKVNRERGEAVGGKGDGKPDQNTHDTRGNETKEEKKGGGGEGKDGPPHLLFRFHV